MSTDAIPALASSLSAAQTADAIQTAVFKKALDSNAQAALGLVRLIPPAPPLATSGTLGTRLNTYG